jgi:hypothetical protein
MENVSTNSMEDIFKEIENAGRSTDSIVGHLTSGEIIIPAQLAEIPEVKAAIEEIFSYYGVNLNEFTAGNEENKINPETGYPEFFLKKLVKDIGKIFKKPSGGSKSSSQSQQDNSMQIWAAEMEKQRQLQQKQYDDMRKQYEDWRKEEEARRQEENAKREQELWNEKQIAKDKEALEKYKTSSQSFAEQVGGDPTEEAIKNSISRKISDASRSSEPAPGLTPFGTSVIQPANLTYLGKIKFGGL